MNVLFLRVFRIDLTGVAPVVLAITASYFVPAIQISVNRYASFFEDSAEFAFDHCGTAFAGSCANGGSLASDFNKRSITTVGRNCAGFFASSSKSAYRKTPKARARARRIEMVFS